MAIGDDAVAAGYTLASDATVANTIDTEINLTRDYIANVKTDLAELVVISAGTPTVVNGQIWLKPL